MSWTPGKLQMACSRKEKIGFGVLKMYIVFHHWLLIDSHNTLVCLKFIFRRLQNLSLLVTSFFVPRIFTLSDLLESQWTDCIPDSKVKVGKIKDGFLHFFYFWKNYMKKLEEHEMEPVSDKISDFVWSGYHIFAAVLVVVVMVAFKILSRIELAVSKPRFDLMKY